MPAAEAVGDEALRQAVRRLGAGQGRLHEALGQQAMMVIADSPSIPRDELKEAVDMATQLGWNLRIVQTAEHLQEAYL